MLETTEQLRRLVGPIDLVRISEMVNCYLSLYLLPEVPKIELH